MPSLADFERDYWAPDREEVLAQMRAEAAPAPPAASTYQAPSYWSNLPAGTSHTMQVTPAEAEYSNFASNYWAPDREQVLQGMLPGQMQMGGAGFGGIGTGMPGGGWQGNPYQGGGGGQFDENALSQAWLSSGGRTPQDLANFFANNPQLVGGAKLVGSKKDKIQLPNGRVVDAVLASGEGGRGAQWLVEGPGGGGGASAGGGASGGYSVGQAPNSTPFNYETFKRPGEFQGPGAFKYEAFDAPDALTMQNDPGYQARLGLGTDAIQKSAAARGTLLTGGTLKDLNQFAQDYGSNEFQNVYNRAFQTHAQNYNQAAQDWAANYQNQLGEYQTNYSNALDAYKTNFETQFKPWEANYNQAYQSWMGNYNAAQQGWMNEQQAQQQKFGQLFNTAQLGLQGTQGLAGAAQGYGNNMSNINTGYGNSMSDLYTGQGNVNAAGQMGSAGAWGNGLTGVGNAANMAAIYSMYGNQNKPTGYYPGAKTIGLEKW